jgi:hypothetical protein
MDDLEQQKHRFGKSSQRHDAVDMDALLELLAEHCNVLEACRRAGCSQSLAYQLRKDNSDFRAAWDKAMAHKFDMIEAETIERAHHGWPVARKTTTTNYDADGNPQKSVTIVERKMEFSPALTIFMLKANMPEKYHLEKKQIEASNSVGSALIEALRGIKGSVPDESESEEDEPGDG